MKTFILKTRRRMGDTLRVGLQERLEEREREREREMRERDERER